MESGWLKGRLRSVRTHWPNLTPLKGQGLVEYALILVLVVLVAFVVITLIGPWVGNDFSNVINAL